MKNILKAWLKKNELTPDKKDFTAVVSSMGSINQAGLIEAIREEGAELSAETLNDVITRYNRHAAQYAVSGWNVDTGLVYLRPVIIGVFYDKTCKSGGQQYIHIRHAGSGNTQGTENHC
jgi:hypothetical protein